MSPPREPIIIISDVTATDDDDAVTSHAIIPLIGLLHRRRNTLTTALAHYQK